MSSPVAFERSTSRTDKAAIISRSGRHSTSVHEERSPTSRSVRDRAKRSQALIQEQVLLVKDTQDALQNVLRSLESQSAGDLHQQSEEQLESLLNKSQELIVMVQVLMKVRNELAYARLDLEKAVKTGIGIETAKKRVKWLQQRLEKVLSTTRSYCQTHLQSPNTQSRSRSVVQREQVSDQLWERLTKSQQRRLFATDADNQSPDNQNAVSVIDDVAKMVPTCSSQDSIKENDAEEIKPPLNPLDKQDMGPSPMLSVKALQSCNHKGKRKKKRRSDPPRVPTSPLKSLVQVSALEDDMYDGGGDTTPEPLSDAEGEHRETSSVISSIQLGEPQIPEPMSGHMLPADGSEITKDYQRGHRHDKEATNERIFQTEEQYLSGQGEEAGEQTAGQGGEAAGQDGEARRQYSSDQGGKEGGQGYWEMDHHRFEWSDYMHELNPRSWHALGLAMQDSFLDKDTPQFESDLPWKEKPMKVNSVIDVHKIALDKLLVRLHRMYDAIGHATQATIDPLPSEEKLEVTMGRLEGGSPTDSRPLSDVMAMYSMPASRDLALPPIPGTANQKAVSFLGRYPLSSEPSMTRIARKSSETLYPRESGVWCTDWSNGHEQPRLVTTKPVIHKKTSNIQSRYLGKKSQNESPSQTERCDTIWKPVMVKRIISAVNKMETEARMRDRSGHVEYTGPKWTRLEVLMSDKGLRSPNPTIAMEAAKSIGQLQCRDAQVIDALADTLVSNTDARVCYEVSKSMILLGTWSLEAMRVVMENIKQGNRHVVSELLYTMSKARNIPFVDKTTTEFRDMVNLLVSLVKYRPFEIAFSAAVSLGRLCVAEPYAKYFLIKKLPTLLPQEKSEALYVLIKQFNCKERVILDSLIHQLESSYNWKHRLEAADLLIFIGAHEVFKVMTQDEVFDVLEKLLWDHANKELRKKISDVLGALGFRQRAYVLALRRLEDPSEGVRGRAVISLATLGMKGVKEMKALLDILELDSSVYVRIQVVRAFSHLEWNDPRILRSLKERERGEGTLANEAGKALAHLMETSHKSHPT